MRTKIIISKEEGLIEVTLKMIHQGKISRTILKISKTRALEWNRLTWVEMKEQCFYKVLKVHSRRNNNKLMIIIMMKARSALWLALSKAKIELFTL